MDIVIINLNNIINKISNNNKSINNINVVKIIFRIKWLVMIKRM